MAGEEKFPVRLPAYYLALHPVTNGQYKRVLRGGAWVRNHAGNRSPGLRGGNYGFRCAGLPFACGAKNAPQAEDFL